MSDIARNQRIAANRGAYFAGPRDVVVQLVEEGTTIADSTNGGYLTAQHGTAIRRGNHLFVTQRLWDELLAHTEVKEIK